MKETFSVHEFVELVGTSVYVLIFLKEEGYLSPVISGGSAMFTENHAKRFYDLGRRGVIKMIENNIDSYTESRLAVQNIRLFVGQEREDRE